MRTTVPNFFIVGAPKAGTDDLFYALEQHPQVYMSPIKEPCYFSFEVRPENFEAALRSHAERLVSETHKYFAEGMRGKRFGGIVTDFEEYQQLFAAVGSEKAIGEGSVCYLWSRTAAEKIATRVPHARIIMVLMDPAERAFHQYLKSLSDGNVSHSFTEHLRAAPRHGDELSVYHPFLAFGEYAEQVTRFKKHFPPSQIFVSVYEDVQNDCREWFSRVLNFIGVDPDFVPKPVEVPSTPHLARLVPVESTGRMKKLERRLFRVLPSKARPLLQRALYRRELPKLNACDRATLVEYYRPDIIKLQDVIGRDLSAWLR